MNRNSLGEGAPLSRNRMCKGPVAGGNIASIMAWRGWSGLSTQREERLESGGSQVIQGLQDFIE